jgi:hypothetical protein
VFGSELDQLFVLMVVVRIEEDLLEVSLRVSVTERYACLVYSGDDRCDFQDFLEVINLEVADTDAPIGIDASKTGEIYREGFGYVVSPSF